MSRASNLMKMLEEEGYLKTEADADTGADAGAPPEAGEPEGDAGAPPEAGEPSATPKELATMITTVGATPKEMAGIIKHVADVVKTYGDEKAVDSYTVKDDDEKAALGEAMDHLANAHQAISMIGK